MFQRHFSSILLFLYVSFCLVCLSWSADPLVRTLKQSFYYVLAPASVPVLSEMDTWGSFGRNMGRILALDQNYRSLEERWRRHLLNEKRFEELQKENARLTQILGLSPLPDYSVVAGRLLAHDSTDWFHSVLIDRGRDQNLAVSDPVIALQGGRPVLVGQIVEVFTRTSRVLLVTDPLCAVSVKVARTGEQGAAEGAGSRRVVVNYLFSDSDVQMGDEIVTAGLGRVFPEGILVGTVTSVSRKSQDSFKTVFLRPALELNQVRELLVLRRSEQATVGKARP